MSRSASRDLAAEIADLRALRNEFAAIGKPEPRVSFASARRRRSMTDRLVPARLMNFYCRLLLAYSMARARHRISQSMSASIRQLVESAQNGANQPVRAGGASVGWLGAYLDGVLGLRTLPTLRASAFDFFPVEPSLVGVVEDRPDREGLLRLIDGILAALGLELIRLLTALARRPTAWTYTRMLVAVARCFGRRGESDDLLLPARQSLSAVAGR